ncbi:MAG TPA: ricin-type beta-trefoil lectin domain protein [Terriglobales bacterium]
MKTTERDTQYIRSLKSGSHAWKRGRDACAAVFTMGQVRVCAALTVCLLATLVATGRASQIQLSSNAPYKCAAVESGDTTNGTPVLSYSCSGSFGQQWNYVNGELQGIGTANGKTMCLDVKGNSGLAGTLVDLWECNGGANQQWWIVPATAGAEKGNAAIMAFAGGIGPGGTSVVCLDSNGGPPVGGGTQLVINDCTFGSSQNWIMRRTEFELNTSAPHLCVADQGGKTVSGTPVIAYSCSGAFNDEWNIVGGKIEGVGTANGAAMCLTGAGAGGKAGTLVTLSTCDGSLNQNWWVISSTENSNGIIMGYPSGLCLDSSGGPHVGGGTQLVVNACNDAASQNWNLH